MPRELNNFIPLSLYGLCEAEIIIPKSASSFLVNTETAGVGMTPNKFTSTPIALNSAANECSNMSPEMRVSFPIKMIFLCKSLLRNFL